MNAYQPYLTIGIVLLFLAGYGALMRGMVSAANPAQQISNVAAALGMQVVEGDPSLNLVLGPRQSILLSLLGVTRYQIRVRLAGPVGAYPATFEVHHKFLQVKLRRLIVHQKEEFHGELSFAAHLPFPFEAWRPNPYGVEYGPQPRLGFPIVSQGWSPSGAWFLASPDPRAAHWVAPMIHQLAQYAQLVHVVVSPGKLSMPFTKTMLPGVCLELHVLRDAMSRIASTLAPSRQV